MADNMFRVRSCFIAIVFASPLFAHAGLPRSANVPGGVAIVPLGSVAAKAEPPRAWLGERSVLVTSNDRLWYAVVGLSLDMPAGSHALRAEVHGEAKMLQFEIGPKTYPEQHITVEDKGKVQLSAADAARVRREIAVIRRLKRHWRAVPDTDPALALPAEGRLAGRFGLRRYFNGQARLPHSGLDVAVPVGTPVTASSRGRVLATHDFFFNGKTVFLDHGNGLLTMYCHLARIDVKAGDTVGKGQPVGLSGTTGRSTGPHLHWSVVLNGAMVDPELFIPESRLATGEVEESPPQ